MRLYTTSQTSRNTAWFIVPSCATGTMKTVFQEPFKIRQTVVKEKKNFRQVFASSNCTESAKINQDETDSCWLFKSFIFFYFIFKLTKSCREITAHKQTDCFKDNLQTILGFILQSEPLFDQVQIQLIKSGRFKLDEKLALLQHQPDTARKLRSHWFISILCFNFIHVFPVNGLLL